MIRNPTALALVLLPLVSTMLPAQTCMGGASFAERPGQVGADFSAGGGASSMTAAASLGARRGPFLTVSAGRAHVENLLENPTVFNVTAAMSTPPLGVPETELCPFISLSILNGLVLPSGETSWSRAYGAGLGVGTRLKSSGTFEAVPFASAALVLQTAQIVHLGPDLPLGWTDDNYLAASLGVGLVYGHVLTIRPSANFATHGRTTQSLGLRVSYAFGHVTIPPPPRPGDGSLATVWANPREMVYYCSGSRWFGNTSDGRFTTEREALAAGYTPANGKRC